MQNCVFLFSVPGGDLIQKGSLAGRALLFVLGSKTAMPYIACLRNQKYFLNWVQAENAFNAMMFFLVTVIILTWVELGCTAAM